MALNSSELSNWIATPIFRLGKKPDRFPLRRLHTACWRRMTQTGEEILGLGSEMLFAAVVLKLCLVHARVHGSHLPHGNSCKEVYHKKGQITSFGPYSVRFDPYPRPVVPQLL